MASIMSLIKLLLKLSGTTQRMLSIHKATSKSHRQSQGHSPTERWSWRKVRSNPMVKKNCAHRAYFSSLRLHFCICVGQMPAHPRLLGRLSDALPPLFGAMGPAGICGRYVGIVVVEKVLRSRSVSISEMTSGGWVNCDYSPLSTPPLTTISIHIHRGKN